MLASLTADCLQSSSIPAHAALTLYTTRLELTPLGKLPACSHRRNWQHMNAGGLPGRLAQPHRLRERRQPGQGARLGGMCFV